MNILFLSTHLNTGGITSYMFTLAKGLVQRGHTVHVLTSGGNREEGFKSVGAHVHTLNIRTKSELSPKIYQSIKSVCAYIDEHAIDVMHAQTRVTQVLGTFVQKRRQIPLVTTCHGYFKTRWSRKLFPCWALASMDAETDSDFFDPALFNLTEIDLFDGHKAATVTLADLAARLLKGKRLVNSESNSECVT